MRKQMGRMLMIFAAVLSLAAAASLVVVVSQNGTFGQFLTGENGNPIYVFTADQRGGNGHPAVSSCYGECAKVWPPVLARQGAAAGAGVHSSLLGTARRDDGTVQLTYNGYPLYYYAKDIGTSELLGQAVNGFGGNWYLVSPAGRMIEKK